MFSYKLIEHQTLPESIPMMRHFCRAFTGSTVFIATLIIAGHALADEKPTEERTAYEVMKALKTSADVECKANGPSCRTFQDMQRQIGGYIEQSCKRLGLSSDDCARYPVRKLFSAAGSENLTTQQPGR